MATTDQELYDEAVSDSPPPVADVPAEEPKATEERTRDERGRFAKAEQSEPQVDTEPEPTPEPEPRRDDHRIPLTELLNEREKRQAEQRRAEALMYELQQLREQLKPAAQVTPPDQFADPEGYTSYWESRFKTMEQQFAEREKAIVANVSLQRAHDKYGESFEHAYSALMESGDRATAKAVAESGDPGETLVRWYKREQTLRTVGDDPESFIQKALDEALNNPEFLARAVEKARGVASTQPSQVRIPPSLNKATAAQSATETARQLSDRDLYEYATGRG